MLKGDKIGTIIIISAVLATVIVLGIFFFGDSYDYVLIDGDDVIEYEIVDGDTIIIHTEDEQYRVKLFDEVVDFTVNSNIHIELMRELILGNPVYDYYRINRIIKVPDGGEY